MKRQQAIQRLEQILERDFNDLEKNIIVADGRRYLAFGRYSIDPRSGIWTVSKYTSYIGEFSSLRSALSWCIADKYNQYQLQKNIFRLDSHKLLLEADIHVRSAMKISAESKMMKVDSRRYRLQQLEFQLDKCINQAKYWQIRGFNNETQRTGRTASYRTNR